MIFCLLQAAKDDFFEAGPKVLLLQHLPNQNEEVVSIGHEFLLAEQCELLFNYFEVHQSVWVLLLVIGAILQPRVSRMAGPYHLLILHK